MAMTDGHEDTVGRRPRIVVGGEPVEPTVHTHVPRITHAAGIEFEVMSTRPTAKNPAFFFILINGMVALLICVLREYLGEGIFRLVIGLDSL